MLFSVDGLDVVLCATRTSRKRAYELRYRAYRASDAISANARAMFKDALDRTPNHRTFLVLDGGRPVATIRSAVYSPVYGWASTEAFLNFSSDIKKHLGANLRFLESNRFAVDPEYVSPRSSLAKMLCFRVHGLNAAAHGCDHVLTCVRTKHVPYFRRFLGMAPINAEPKVVPWLGDSAMLISAPTQIAHRTAVNRGMPDYTDADVDAFIAATGLGVLIRQPAVAPRLAVGMAR